MLFKKYWVTIPCMACGRRVDYEDTGLAAIEKKLREEHPQAAHYGEGWTQNVRRDWACSSCIEQGRVILGDPLRQELAAKGPYFAYADRNCHCQRCKQDFVLSAAEQKFWFEDLRFHPRSRALHCIPCRREVRRPRVANRKLSERLAALDPSDWRQLREVGELYSTIGVREQALLYLRRAKNRCEIGPERNELLTKIAELIPLR